ncbi:hypothetical protein BVRB_6g145610 [Beta vulgaris subsp. vulgaris]|nr:hypothetical protein BVRB_6g145610 [Beta vulgaris subsp. vulgaris]
MIIYMDTLAALALATEPPNDELMKRPPVGRDAYFITNSMWRNIISHSIYQLVALGVLQFDGKHLHFIPLCSVRGCCGVMRSRF